MVTQTRKRVDCVISIFSSFTTTAFEYSKVNLLGISYIQEMTYRKLYIHISM